MKSLFNRNAQRINVDDCDIYVGGEIQDGFLAFGRDDLDDIICDLQEEYYRLSIGKDVVLKIKIADLIERLCQMRESMDE